MNDVKTDTAATQQSPARNALTAVVRVLGSLQLSVCLLLILALLTWLGTLAQVDKQLYLVQKEYFESWFVKAKLPISIWGWQPFETPLQIPLPGAYPVMAVLFVNLIVGGMLRMKLRARNVGILITHVGIALLLIAGFVKMHYSYSGHMSLWPAPTNGRPVGDRVTQASQFVSFDNYELALLRDDGKDIEERVVSETALAGAKDGVVTLHPAGMPFTVEVSHWCDNCEVMPKGPMFTPPVPVVDGLFLLEQKPSEERAGDIAGCYVTVVESSGARHEGIVRGFNLLPYSAIRSPYTFTVAGKRYGLDLRRVIYDLPFTVRLDEFRKNDHPGTTMAKDFRSFVTVMDGTSERKVQIYMNTPLRKAGFVFYQAQFGPPAMGGSNSVPEYYTVLEVASNPSDQWPMYACVVIGVGMAVHFIQKLWKFLRSSTRKALQS